MAVEATVAGKYRVGRRIGGGSFGDIYIGICLQSGKEVGIKVEASRTKHPQLMFEAKLYKLLKGGVGIPEVHWIGKSKESNVMVMDLLGPSLENLFNFCNRKFTLKTVLMIADQMLSRIEYLHSRSYLHRDIKPDNFLMGTGKRANQVNMIDFGLAKKYRDPHTYQHIPYLENKNLTGTARYASVNAHLGREQSRRDDLESLGYVLLYFLKGGLPWQGLRAATKKQKYEKIRDSKHKQPLEKLCQGCPSEFLLYFRYIRSLKFTDKPDYSGLRKRFRDLFLRNGYTWDYVFDWCVVQNALEVQKRPYDLSSRAVLGSAREALGLTHRSNNAGDDEVKGITKKKKKKTTPAAPKSRLSFVPSCFSRCNTRRSRK